MMDLSAIRQSLNLNNFYEPIYNPAAMYHSAQNIIPEDDELDDELAKAMRESEI